jgi:serine/threonine-protein kinase
MANPSDTPTTPPLDFEALTKDSEVGSSMLSDDYGIQLSGHDGDPEPETEHKRLVIAPVLEDERYEQVAWIASGAMGEVLRVRDRQLNCYLAMKIMRGELLRSRSLVARFIEEAQVTAQLDHAGICPIHEIGKLADGRWYYTMKEVKAYPLNKAILALHENSTQGQWQPTKEGWNFRRLIEVFRKVCEAVAYAHSRSVIHRDLKPENVVCGPHGEVLVVDWGLAKVLGRADWVDVDDEEDLVQTNRSENSAMATRMGMVAGTPSYMSPEQARGEIDRIDSHSDVYSLGAVLYEILSGHPPFEGDDGRDILDKVLAGPPRNPPGPRPLGVQNTQFFLLQQDALGGPSGYRPPPVPEDLVDICNRAMSRELEDRYPDATALEEHISAWLDGSSKRTQALVLVHRAEALVPQIRALRKDATRLRAEAATGLDRVEPHAATEGKHDSWELEDNAASLEHQASFKEAEIVSSLQAALAHAPDLKAAHDALAARYRQQHEAAEARRDDTTALLAEQLLRAHDDGTHAVYLSGEGTLTLHTDPTGAQAVMYEYREENRRLVPVKLRALGPTPLQSIPLQSGSYLLEISHPRCVPVRLPIHMGRSQEWSNRPTSDAAPVTLALPFLDEMGHDDLYVPAGQFWSGGDTRALESLPRRQVWVDGFVMRRFPVTNREYLLFLNGLVNHGRDKEAAWHCPREEGGEHSFYGKDPSGRYSLRKDKIGNMLRPDWPVLKVSWEDAMAYALWESDRSAHRWRLPSELEWEKAARGADGRFHPWGDHFEPTWTCTRDSHAGQPQLAVVHRFPVDESPFGIRHMGGNAGDWCLEAFDPAGPTLSGNTLVVETPEIDADHPLRSVRGGGWRGIGLLSRSANRQALVSSGRSAEVSFRLVRPYQRHLR